MHIRFFGFLLVLMFVLGWGTGASAQSMASPYDFETSVARLEAAVAANDMFLIATASASRGAAGQGIVIPGNAVLLVFRNDYARRMLAASIEAGIEAPLRIYVTANAAGAVAVRWQVPTAVFAPYKNAALDALAQELDPIFLRIVAQALARP
jgi:uncharacterized protein (DUF302 family)